MNTKGHCYPKCIILQAVYFKLRFTLSYWDVKDNQTGLKRSLGSINLVVLYSHLGIRFPHPEGMGSDKLIK
jgi:hypothetical protein